MGIVGKPFGRSGEVFVWPDPDLGHMLVAGTDCLLDGRRAEIVAVRVHRGRHLVRFRGVDDRTAAEGLRDRRIEIPRADVVADPDALWVDELMGREVVDDSGGLIGVVADARDGPAHDYLVIARPDGSELWIPAVTALLDVGDRIVVRRLPGLLDPGEAWA